MDPLSLVGVQALCKRIKCTGRVFRGLSNSGWEKEVSVPRASQIFWSNCLRSEGPEVGRWEWFGGFGSLLGPTSLAQQPSSLWDRVVNHNPKNNTEYLSMLSQICWMLSSGILKMSFMACCMIYSTHFKTFMRRHLSQYTSVIANRSHLGRKTLP